jgi:peptidoglycan-associated lipoprotein
MMDSTTYTLTANGPGGTQTASVRVKVIVPPAPPPPPGGVPGPWPLEHEFASLDKDVYFDFDQATVRPDAEKSLARNANFLKDKEAEGTTVTLEGYCDERGSEEYNLALGERRAIAVKNFLVDAGVSAARISAISYGKSRPVCTYHGEVCREKDRRVHFLYRVPFRL